MLLGHLVTLVERLLVATCVDATKFRGAVEARRAALARWRCAVSLPESATAEEKAALGRFHRMIAMDHNCEVARPGARFALARLREQEDRQTYLAQLGTVLAVAAQAQDDDDAVRARNVLEDEVWLYRELRKVRRRTA